MEILDIKKIENWGVDFDKVLTISGPCSAESEEQLIETAKQLSKIKQVNVLRAGIWKPRTKPGNFEGHGEKALPWLLNAKKETGLKTTIEVATPEHVELALKYNVDILWIGARTTVSPFVVQDIADSLKGVDIPILVKNPVNPDIDLWIGGLERLNQAGLKKLGGIHRGFSSYAKNHLRNQPQWQLVVELMNKVPNLPLICDPSHICGQRESLYEISQTALDLQFNGLMIEAHINPDEAWSDAKQQVTPNTLKDLINKLIKRNPTSEDEIFNKTLNILREDIDEVDSNILELLSLRMGIVKTIGYHKKKSNVTVLQPNRWKNIVNKRLEEGKHKGFSEKFIEMLFKSIHQESIRIQEKIMNIKQ